MKKNYILLVLAILVFSQTLHAQVGINTANPHTSAALHIFDSEKGVLLPYVNKSSRDNKAPIAANGLLVYDEAEKVYYFRDNQSGKWITLNPWRTADGVNNNVWGDIRLDSVHKDRNVYIGGNLSQKAEAKLHVDGDTKIGGVLNVAGEIHSDNKITSNQNVTSSTGFSTTSGNIKTTDGNIETTNGEFIGYGTVPKGTIVMWSGTNIPIGWALCDGTNGTPNLKGRFVVGYDPADSDYNNPGNYSQKGTIAGKSGGQREVTLTIDQIPSHTHKIRHWGGGSQHHGDRTQGNDTNNDDYGFNRETSATGGGQPHENRPPYYALAFIMRIN